MTDREKDTPTVILIDQHEAQRRAAEERQRAIDAGEVVQLDKTVPGGKYQAPDGRFHDAHGREITEDGELASETQYEHPPAVTAQVGGPEVTDAAREGESDEEGAWRAHMVQQRRDSEPPEPGSAPILGDSVLPPLDDEEEEVDEATGTKRKVRRRRRPSK